MDPLIQIEALEELSSFVGQVILEVREFNDKVITNELVNIQRQLCKINASIYNSQEFYDPNFNEYVTNATIKYEINTSDVILPMGTSHICCSVCKRVSEHFLSEEILSKNVYVMLMILKKYFYKLGIYINYKLRKYYFYLL